MMLADAVLCARGVSIDRDSGALSIFQIIDGMEATGFPVLIPSVSVVCILERSADEAAKQTCQLQILQDSTIVVNEQVQIDFGQALRHRQSITVQNVVIQSPATVFVKFRHNNADLGVYRFPVTAAKTPANR
jgi:hypothetical protein